MLTPDRLFRRLRSLINRRSLDDQMDEEMRLHLQLEAEDAVRRGVPADQADARARLAFGGVQRFREEGRDARGDAFVRELWSDVRYAVRVLRRAPLFTTVAVVTLGLGIGANSAIFSVVNAVVLRPLGFADEQALVSVWDGGHSRAEFVAIHERARSLSSSAAYMQGYDFTLGGDGEPERVVSALVSADFFTTLGTAPALGRYFAKGDDAPGAEPVVVLGDGLWRRRFGADPRVIGRTVELDGIRRRVIGVAPARFAFPSADTRLWVPLEINPAQPGPHWGAYGHNIIGRLAAGATPAQVRDEVHGIALALIGENPIWKPDSSAAQGITVTPLRDQLVKESRSLLYLLSGAVGLVLLVACANVANLLMVRGSARERELAIRTTLGAGTRRLARQLLTESLVLATAGGLLGLLIAWGLTGVLIGLLPTTTPRLGEARLDPLVVTFTMALALATGVVFGVLPARRSSRRDPGSMMHGGRSTASAGQRRVAGLLVSAQIATAVILTVGAGLVVRSLDRLLAVDPGFETTHVVTAKVSPPRASYREKAAQRAVTTQILDQLRGAPGIQSVAVSSQVPFEPRNEVMAMWIDGWTSDPNKLEVLEVRRVTPDFFRVMGIPVTSGRTFLDSDVEGGEAVAVISQSAVDKFWAGRDPLRGGRLRFPWPGWQNVVGVVADVRNNDLRTAALPTVYLAYAQDPVAFVSVVARTAGDPQQALAAIRSSVRSVAPDIAVSDEQQVQQMVERSVAAPRSVGVLLATFGALALVLGGIGTYGLVAYAVESRRQEFAVRMAIGAGRRAVVGLVMREGLRLAAIGIVVGLAAAFWLSKLLQSLLFGIERTDIVSFAVAPTVLAAVTVLACGLPAWYATRVDPNGALRGS